jgi:hypothetical protein
LFDPGLLALEQTAATFAPPNKRSSPAAVGKLDNKIKI